MSKYTEAIARKINEENYYHDCMISYLDTEPVSEHYKDMIKKASLELEALQIADKVVKLNVSDYISDHPVRGVSEYQDGYLDGYKKAVTQILSDISLIVEM